MDDALMLDVHLVRRSTTQGPAGHAVVQGCRRIHADSGRGSLKGAWLLFDSP